jgi:hypothetical protein
MRRNGSRHEQNLVELSLPEAVFGHDQVPEVDWIETSAEDADPLCHWFVCFSGVRYHQGAWRSARSFSSSF